MHGTTVAFGERALLLGDAPARLPGTVLLPAGEIRPGHGAPPPRPTSAIRPTGTQSEWATQPDGLPPRDEVLLPGSQDTVRGRAEHASNPAAEQRRATAADALGLRLTAQDRVDIPAADRLASTPDDELRYAAAMLDLGAWRYKIEHCPPGSRLAALLEQRPDDLEPAPGKGEVIGAECDGIPGGAVPEDVLWPKAVVASIAARNKLIAHLQARQYADIARLSGSYNGIHQFLATELALALHGTDAEAAALLNAAEALRDRLPDTQQALLAGRIDDAKAMAILRATTTTTSDVAHIVEQQVLPDAGTVTAPTVRRRAGRAVIAADPDGAADRHRRARTERHVYRNPDDDGMARLGMYAPAQDIATIWEAVTAVADAIRGPGDERTLGHRRADALVMICSDIVSAGGWSGLRLPDKGRGRPRINVTMPYTALLGHRAPCELAGHGAITTEQALSLAGAGDLYRMICDPITGQMLDYGHQRYKPPPHLAEFVRMRDGECPMPSCHQPAARGQLDHIVPAKPDPVTGKPTLGTTSAGNLGPPCGHHHLGKDAGRGFTLHRAADGTYTWTTPLGLSYTWRPEPHWHNDTDAVPVHSCDQGDGRRPSGTADHIPVDSASPRRCTCLPRSGPGGNAAKTGHGDINNSATRETDCRSHRDDVDTSDDAADAGCDDATGAGCDDAANAGCDDAADAGDDVADAGTIADIPPSPRVNAAGAGSVGDATATDADGRPRRSADAGTIAPAPESGTPVCDCPDTCRCQHGSAPDPHDRLIPLTIDGDWADGFVARAGAEGPAAVTDTDSHHATTTDTEGFAAVTDTDSHHATMTDTGRSATSTGTGEPQSDAKCCTAEDTSSATPDTDRSEARADQSGAKPSPDPAEPDAASHADDPPPF